LRLGIALQGFLKDFLDHLPPLRIHFLSPTLFAGAAKRPETPIVMEIDMQRFYRDKLLKCE